MRERGCADAAFANGFGRAEHDNLRTGVQAKPPKYEPRTQDKTPAVLLYYSARLDTTLGGPPYNLSLQDRPFLRPREGYWKTIEEDLHWHLEILPQVIGMTGFERASWFFYNPVPPKLVVRCLSG